MQYLNIPLRFTFERSFQTFGRVQSYVHARFDTEGKLELGRGLNSHTLMAPS